EVPRPRPSPERVHPLAGGRRHQARRDDRPDGRPGLQRGRGRGRRPRRARHRPAADGHRAHPADVSFPGPRFPAHRRERKRHHQTHRLKKRAARERPGGTAMRILLVQPPQGTRFGLSRILTGEPLGLECVGGAVRSRGYDAEVVDLRLDSWDALDRALDHPPAAVGVSCAFTTDVYPSLEIARFLKDRWPALPVVVGGHHASLVPEDFLCSGSGVDAVAIGEGEWTSVGIMDALRDGQPLETVPGVLTSANQGKGNGFRPRPFTRELGERIEAEGLRKTYACETRCDLVVRYRDLFARWSRAGLRTIFLGIERIDDAGLDAVRKRTKGGSSTNVQAIHILREEGITPM